MNRTSENVERATFGFEKMRKDSNTMKFLWFNWLETSEKRLSTPVNYSHKWNTKTYFDTERRHRGDGDDSPIHLQHHVIDYKSRGRQNGQERAKAYSHARRNQAAVIEGLLSIWNSIIPRFLRIES